jgi:hypothetical protein
MDEQRLQLTNDIKEKLIELNHIVLDVHVNENCYSIDYEIITDKNNIVLSINMFYESKSLFDELSIYNGNTLLFEVPLNENQTSKEICEIVYSNIKYIKYIKYFFLS